MSQSAILQSRRRRDLFFAGTIAAGLLLVLAATGATPWPEALFVTFILAATLVLYYRGVVEAVPPSPPVPYPLHPPHPDGPEARAAQAARLDLGPALPDWNGASELGGLAMAMPDPFLVASIARESEIIAVNDAARELFGVGDKGLKFSTVLRRPELLDAMRKAVETGAPQMAELHFLGAVERFLLAHIAGFRWRGRELLAIVVHDETLARKTEQMRGDFVANASHELKTPLAALSGFIQTLRGHAREDPVARDRFLAIMESQAERMSRLIADLLSLSRIELNEHVPPRGIGDLIPATREAIDTVEPIALNRRVRIETEFHDSSALIRAIPDELVQIVQNLVDNAIKYSPDPGVVKVSLKCFPDREEALAWAFRSWPDASQITIAAPLPAPGGRPAPNYVALRVEDHGPGISREHLARLSERFYRVPPDEIWAERPDPAISEAERVLRRGTGLGLAIVKHIVKRYKGGLGAESRRGKGSAFGVCFPLADSHGEPLPGTSISPFEYDDAPPPMRGGMPKP